MINEIHYKHFVFLEKINELIKVKLLKFNNINIIIDIDKTDKESINNETTIINFAKKNKIPFYIKNSYRSCIKKKADGIYIESKNSSPIRPISLKKMLIIGCAHNQIEFFFKKRQGCNIFMLSPIFKNNKYADNKILGAIRFNFISMYWNETLIALGGINSKNRKKINLTKAEGYGFKRFVSDQ